MREYLVPKLNTLYNTVTFDKIYILQGKEAWCFPCFTICHYDAMLIPSRSISTAHVTGEQFSHSILFALSHPLSRSKAGKDCSKSFNYCVTVHRVQARK
jgi:hypothetical protein